MRGSNSNAKLESEVESLLLQQQQRNRGLILERERGLLEREGLILERERGLLERERGLEINRSGSAPPTVEGALLAAGNLLRYPNGSSIDNSTNLGVLTEEEIRSHPAYLEYYYSHENLNPRLPPPLLSKEDWRVTQRVRAAGLGRNVIDNGGSMLLYPMPFGLSVKKAEEEMIELRKTALRNLSRKSSAECLDNGSAGMGVRRKSFADILQEGSSQPAKSNLSRHASQNSVADVSDSMGPSSFASAELQNKAQSFEAMLPEKTFVALSNTRNLGSVNPISLASCASSALNSNRPELVGRPISPGLVALGNGVHVTDNLNLTTLDARNFSTSGIFEIADITASLSGLTLPRGQPAESISRSSRPLGISTSQQQVENLINNMNYVNRVKANASTRGPNVSPNPMLNEGVSFPRRTCSSATLPTQYSPSDFARLEDLKIQLQGANLPGVNISTLRNGGYSVNQNPDVILGSLLAGGNRDGHLLRPSYPPGFHIPVMDPHQLQYMQKISNHGNDFTRVAGNSSQGTHFDDLQALEKAYLETLLLQQAQQYQSHVLQKPGSMNHQYQVNPAFNPSSASCQGNMTLNSQNAREGSRSSTFQNERSTQMPSNLESLKGGSSGSLHSQSGSNSKGRFESLLETLKNNKAKSLELQDILGHVMEFSTDQFGSRFIQQKLETATVEEKTKILAEIIPNVLVLMIDVFGNYVVQKFFEHGTESQRNELARHLIGHVLPLTLQMYGCRVIQKALEVVDIDIRAKMAAELDGSVTKCVHDQNGNHVIQKCIECIPQDRIQFIISAFLGQVITLSTHPYGCRVIQRVLEHCGDPKTQDRIMDEIMSSVCKLAQDQYGNYVIQHVVQHGRPHERAVIISKLAGQIVKMSQQKFASNVVEKCLTYGSPQERKLLVNEILGSTDENEPLQAMMKDPFGNYVVQKVLETCDDSSRELILSRIKVHLNALKRYTYGKHIVTRVEKLVVTGEKHIGQSSSSSSSKYPSSVYTSTG